MPIIKVTAEDIKKGKPVDPGWYKGELVNFTFGANSKKDGFNYVPTFSYSVEGEQEAREISTWISDKSRGWKNQVSQLYHWSRNESLPNPEEMEAEEIDTDDIELGNASFWLLISVDTFNGQPNNKLDKFLPYNGDNNPPA